MLSPSARIAVIGAGPAGLTCAEELRERGFTKVTLFEAAPRAGGKSRSVPYEGAPRGGRGLFEAGTVFFLPGPIYTKLLARYRVPARCVSMPRLLVADLQRGRVMNAFRASERPPLLEMLRQLWRFRRLLSKSHAAQLQHAGLAAHVTPELCEPAETWLAAKGLSWISRLLLPLAAGAQFGPQVAQTPALYVLRLLVLLERYSLFQQLRSQMLQLHAGNGAVWQKVAATHDVRLGEPVTALSRHGGTVRLATAKGEATFDAVITTVAARRFLDFADADDAERDLLGRVRTMERVVVTARVSGLPPGIFYAPRFNPENTLPPAHPSMFHEVDAGSGVFNFYPYLDGGRSVEDADAAIVATVRRLGGKVESFLHRAHVRDWAPQFSREDLLAGAPQRLEAMQGRRGTFFAGEVMAGVGVPHVTEHAAALVRSF